MARGWEKAAEKRESMQNGQEQLSQNQNSQEQQKRLAGADQD